MNKKKLLRQVYNNNKNVNFSDFIILVEAFGFILTRSDGSHFIYKNNEINEWINLQNKNGEAKPYQIKQFLSLIEKYDLEMEE
ncbi:MAG: type II toxin-antitoxin system HicA family toxin [Oscillospiraceae bacterium]|nr:type II toxin-antitoxin system HicA family toxin [Oscillospiraceae bacterium]